MKVKCVFQGGGAKLATLLAAAEVMEDLQRDGEIEIEEAAGTSAGSIAAYCLASSRPTAEFRARIRDAGQSYIQQFEESPSKWTILVKLWQGKPIFDEQEVRNFIRSVIGEDEKSESFLSELKIPIHITAVNIRHSEPQYYRSRDDNTRIEDALLNSCAIPIAFRTFQDIDLVVDGGICSNLPNTKIFDDSINKNIIAFSFKRTRGYEPKNVQQYLSALLSTSIDNSVRTAAQEIAAEGGYVCELPNRFDTFDFRKALENGLSDQTFTEEKDTIRKEIENNALNLFRIRQEEEYRNKKENSLELIRSIHKRFVTDFPYTVQSSAMIALPYSLFQTKLVPDTPNDTLIKKVKFQPIGGALRAVEIGITKGEKDAPISVKNWRIHDSRKQPIKADIKVIEYHPSDDDKDNVVYSALAFLEEKVEADRCPITVTFSSAHTGLMNDLIEHRVDWMRSTSRNSDVLPNGDLVIALPKDIGTVLLSDLLANVVRAQNKPYDHSTMGENWLRGRKMEGQELQEYAAHADHLPASKLHGWRSENIPKNYYFGVLIELTT